MDISALFSILYTCLVICLLLYKFFTSCFTSFINSFEILLVYILDKRIGKELIVKPLLDDFLVNNIFFKLLRYFTYKSTYLPYFFYLRACFQYLQTFLNIFFLY